MTSKRLRTFLVVLAVSNALFWLLAPRCVLPDGVLPDGVLPDTVSPEGEETGPGSSPGGVELPPEGTAGDVAILKQEEAQEKLKELEALMERLSRLLATTEPHNAAKLRFAFEASRKRLLREGMDDVIELLRAKKLDRALEDQKDISQGLEELLAILLEKDIDPRELLRHIRRLRDIVKDLDQVIREETSEKAASDMAVETKKPLADLAEKLADLDALIQKQKKLETQVREANVAGESRGGQDSELEKKVKDFLGKLAPRQEDIRAQTAELRDSESGAGGTRGSGSEGSGSSQQLDSQSLSRAEAAMKAAAGAMKAGEKGAAESQAKAARKHLEAALKDAEDKLERLQAKRDFPGMKKDQDETKKTTDNILDRMQETPPLTSSPEGGVPGRKDVEKASGSMGSASQSLSGGNAGDAGGSQEKALDELRQGREQAEEALERLQKALRDRLLAYLRERCTFMLENQRKISGETRSLDARLRALAVGRSPGLDPASDSPDESGLSEDAVDRKDLQRAQDLARGEGALAVVALDVVDLLEEDGTTLVFPRIVGEVRRDMETAQGLLSRVKTGALTQRIQADIEATLEEILAAIELAQRSPPPPNPNSGRSSPSGAGPLLPTSAELKMVRAMQVRVNRRTRDFDLDRESPEASFEEKKVAEAISLQQREIENLLRKIARAIGERSGEPSRERPGEPFGE